MYYEVIQDEKKNTLYIEALKIKEVIEEITDQITHAEKEKGFLENIIGKITGESQERSIELNPDNWIKMVEFYRTKLDSIDAEIREAKKRMNEQKKKLLQEEKKGNHNFCCNHVYRDYYYPQPPLTKRKKHKSDCREG